jgi:DNA-binding HxlR family transcriptional regulator
MKSEKITKKAADATAGAPASLDRRWYDDACGTALALELVGERWALLIVRELMFGGRRFSELRASLPGISANVLTQRLEGLERVGIVQRRKLPPPASAQIYELTEWGYEAEPAIQTLGRWAVRSPLHDPTLSLSAASIMMSFRTMYSPERIGKDSATLGVRFGEETFVIDVGPDGLTVRREDPEGCPVLVDTTPPALGAVVYNDMPVEDAEAEGMMTVTGDRDVLKRFASWFELPPKAG